MGGGGPLGDQTPVGFVAGLGAVLAQVEIAAVDADDGLAGRLVEAIGGRFAESGGYGATWESPRSGSTTTFSGPLGRTADRRRVHLSCVRQAG